MECIFCYNCYWWGWRYN